MLRDLGFNPNRSNHNLSCTSITPLFGLVESCSWPGGPNHGAFGGRIGKIALTGSIGESVLSLSQCWLLQQLLHIWWSTAFQNICSELPLILKFHWTLRFHSSHGWWYPTCHYTSTTQRLPGSVTRMMSCGDKISYSTKWCSSPAGCASFVFCFSR